MSDLRDPITYRLAIGSIGFALATVLTAIAWVATIHEKIPAYVHEKDLASLSKDVPHFHLETSLLLEVSHVPAELLIAAAALGGVLVGILIPLSVEWPRSHGWIAGAIGAAAVASLTALAICEHTYGPYAFAVALLLGLQVPSPAGPIGSQRL